ncbi:MAG: type II CAAX endopeptidase family protein [Planctomycetota bacterium]
MSSFETKRIRNRLKAKADPAGVSNARNSGSKLQLNQPESTPKPPESNSQKTIEEVLQSLATPRTKAKRSTQLDYERETKRPFVNLIFIFPFLILYESGSLWLGPNFVRSGIDQWLQQWIPSGQTSSLSFLPILLMAVLVIWFHKADDECKVRPQTLGWMLLEAAALGLILYFAAKAVSYISGVGPPVPMASVKDNFWQSSWMFVGSGIYEELIFRLFLLTGMIAVTKLVIRQNQFSTTIAVVLVSLIFATVHYNVLNPGGSTFESSTFAFRTVASIVFCTLFLHRGFGIAVGTHIAYDLLTQI